MIMGYLLSNFTLLGNIILEYSQFYVLLMFKSQLSTTLYKDFSIELLLIPNADIITSYPHYKDFIFECLAIPLLLIYVFGAIGYLMKRCVKVKNSIKINIVYDMFTYQAFLNIFIIFSPNLLFNSAQFVSFVTSNSVPLDSTEKTIGSILVYFSLLTLITITYMHIYVLNPKLKET
jgi:H+/Cl- antiporter ClcA